MSIVDNPPNLVRAGKKHGPGLIILGTSLLFHSHTAFTPLKAALIGFMQL
jgi:hypothetical protein